MVMYELANRRMLTREDGQAVAHELVVKLAAESEKTAVLRYTGDDVATVSFLDELVRKVHGDLDGQVKLVFEGFSDGVIDGILARISGTRGITLYYGSPGGQAEPILAKRYSKRRAETCSFAELESFLNQL